MTPTDPPTFQLLNEIAIIEQLARNALERALPDRLRQPHFGVLTHLVRRGDGVSPGGLARAFQTSKAAMTNTLHRLETRGFIRVEGDPKDGRGKRVFLTDAGRAMRERAIVAVWPQMAAIGGVLSEAEIAEILPHLRRLRTHLDAARD
ncbi:MAG: MarR family winged helix-turn-helix transcriptional regulator [Alphaproteobacteria bacterium]